MKTKLSQVGLIILLVGSATLLRSQSTMDRAIGPAVITAIAPHYPAIAISAQAGGKVEVEVAIDASGKVTPARGISGPKLLQTISELTAKRWQFAVVDDPTERKATLTFTFAIAPHSDDARIAFHPPYEVELIYDPPQVVHMINSDPPNVRKKH